MTARYRAAIIGCGDIGHAHAQGYLANPEVELRRDPGNRLRRVARPDALVEICDELERA